MGVTTVFGFVLGAPAGPELLILLLAVPLLVGIALGFWVYTDASKRDNELAMLWAMIVGLTTIIGVVPGLIAVVVYILQRDETKGVEDK